MARKCQISGKIRQSGHRVSHAKNRTKHAFDVNIQARKLVVPDPKHPGQTKTIRVRVTTRMLRTIDKLGLDGALRAHNMTIADLA